ncbi:MAG: hypothetical protein CSA50_08020 [Gammaproteobacteria bacterium]|nr:MAG: hypothetical protein CSA50_08020 [Gammaproteobacteria bacterium]
MGLKIENLSWGADAKRIVDGVSLEIADGEFVGIVGPNGSGKSSLLRCIYRVNHPLSGRIFFNGRNIWEMTAKELARETASVIQETSEQFELSIKEVVMMGRNPHKGLLDKDNKEDEALVSWALEQVGLLDFKERLFHTLSGGEKQRTLIARALAQQAQFIMLDEPTNHLDIHYQLEIMELVKRIKVTSLVVMHDLNLAAMYCDRIYVMNHGKIHIFGPPEEILTEELINEVYRVNVDFGRQKRTGKLHLSFSHR